MNSFNYIYILSSYAVGETRNANNSIQLCLNSWVAYIVQIIQGWYTHNCIEYKTPLYQWAWRHPLSWNSQIKLDFKMNKLNTTKFAWMVLPWISSCQLHNIWVASYMISYESSNRQHAFKLHFICSIIQTCLITWNKIVWFEGQTDQ